MNPHLVGEGEGSAERSPRENANSPMNENELLGAEEAQRAWAETQALTTVDPDALRESIPADRSSSNLPVRYGSTASTEVARAAVFPDELQRPEPAAEPAHDGRARTGALVVGELLVTVNAVDGTTAVPCPPGVRPTPVLVAAEARPRPRPATGHLLERDALGDRLRDRLSQGRCVRLIGQTGSGRTALLDSVAAACVGLAPAGVVHLTGHRRTPADLLQELFAATHRAPGLRPGREELSGLLRGVGAIVVIDDLAFGGEALEELLSAAPECAFLVATTPEVAAPLATSRMEDVTVPGLSRQASLNLLARLAGRGLDETERSWAVDLWFESEGLPIRFVQAAALLRHREAAIEALAAGLPGTDWEGLESADEGVQLLHTQRLSGLLVDPAAGGSRPTPGGFEAYHSNQQGPAEPLPPDPVPLPSVAESAAPAARIARGLSEPARRTLRLATALGGECPTAPHLPALIDVGHGEAALDELVEAGLAEPAGVHHRLTDRVAALLADEWTTADPAREAAQHFAWWTGHASVSEEQIADEAEVLLATMHADREAGRHASVVLLARAAAPAFALTLNWGPWERALRYGLESARETGAVAEEAWFHHELGLLALSTGAFDRSRAELEASIALRAALGDARGAAGGRAALGLLSEAGTMLTARPVLLSVGGSSRSGLRRLAKRGGGDGAGDGPVTRRQIAAAVAGVVLMGALGSAVALGVGAFDSGDGHRPATVVPGASVSSGPGSDATTGGAPTATASLSPSATPSGSAGASPSDTAGGPQSAGQGAGTTPSAPQSSQSRSSSSAPVNPPPASSSRATSPASPTTAAPTTASASPSTSSPTPSTSASTGAAAPLPQSASASTP